MAVSLQVQKLVAKIHKIKNGEVQKKYVPPKGWKTGTVEEWLEDVGAKPTKNKDWSESLKKLFRTLSSTCTTLHNRGFSAKEISSRMNLKLEEVLDRITQGQ